MCETLVKSEEFKDSPLGRLPQDWKVIKLGDVTDIENGTTPSREEPKFWSEGAVPWLTTGKVHDRFINQADEFITEYALRLCSLRLLPIGTVLVAMIGQGLTRGKVAYLASEASINQNFGAILPCSLLDSRFLFHYLDFNYEYVRGSSRGSNQQALNCAVIAQLQVVCPPKEEQRRIAEILDTLDEAIAQTSSLIAKLKQMKAGLLHDLLTQGLDENGELRDAIGHPEQFKDSPLGQIPKDWEVVPIQQAASQVPGATTIGPFGSNLLASDYRSVGVPVTFVRDIKADGFQWNSNIYVEPKKAHELSVHSVQPGDLLATKMGLPPCIACVYPEWMASGIITADIIRLRPNTQISTSQWLSLFVNSHAVIRQVRGITGGITRDKITLHDFRKLLIALPRLKEQKQITNILDTYNSRICCEEAYREKLKLQKQGLMHDLLIGKIRIL